MQAPAKRTEPSPAIEQYGKREKRTHRKEIQLTESENAQLVLHSEAQGYSTTKFILACLRARFLKNPQLGQKELDGLTQSNLQLLAIGRNLNQIAKALNTVTIERPQFALSTIEDVREKIKAHVKTVALIIDASVERWGFKT
jgi:MobC-like protein